MAIITVKNRAITLDAAEIPNLDASKITTGTFADARIAASNVSQHAQSFDDNKIVNDISTLGLRVHTQENLNASNTNSASFDVFQDSSGITNLSNAVRNDNEYVFSGSESLGSETLFVSGSGYSASQVASGSFATNTLSAQNWTVVDNSTHTRTTGHYNSDDSREQGTLWGIFASSGQSANSTYNYFGQYTATSQADVYYAFDTTANAPRWALSRFKFDRIWETGTPNVSFLGSNDLTGSWTNIKTMTLTTTAGEDNQDSGTFSNSNEYRYYQIKIHNIPSSCDVGMRHLKIFGKTFSESITASGSFEGNAITASSTNNMGAVITYQDNAGTNALNTDIVLKLSADNGSNYSTATLTALPDFATGIKMAKVNDLSVTAGTQLKYKIEFANQASGSKEARIRGVSLQY